MAAMPLVLRYFAVVLFVASVGAGDVLFDKAMNAARAADYKTALPLFRQILAQNPSPENWNNVGVTHMRLGEHTNAYHAFMAGKRAAGGRKTDNEENLRVLKGLQADIEQVASAAPNIYAAGWADAPSVPSPPKRRQLAPPDALLHRREKFPRIHITQLYAQENVKYSTGQLPFVLTGLFDQPSWRSKPVDVRKDWTLEFFRTHFGDARVDYYPHNMDVSTVSPILMDMERAIRDLRGEEIDGSLPRSVYNIGRYIQWNMNDDQYQRLRRMLGVFPPMFESDNVWLRSCLEKQQRDEFFIMTHWRMLLIGNEEAGMFFHKDTLHTSSFQIQVGGAKRWHVCAPSQEPFLYDAGQVDTFNPDYVKYPNFKQASCYDDIVRAGEAIYYPRDYWHQTFNMETPSISISSTLVDLDNYPHVWAALELELSGLRRTLLPASDSLKQALRSKCFPSWNTTFGSHSAYIPGGLTPLDVV